ncbi:MAG: SPOR domain-containing protein [Candidatus Symbiothrix sp.]|jgi:hypothetical protein|nr:SPOR domain-containing protein [Candidatus Symbiothrix sp.]
MDRKICFLIAFSLMLCASVQAQTIIEDLEGQTLATDGRIRIDADPSVDALIGRASDNAVAQSKANAAAITAAVATAAETTIAPPAAHATTHPAPAKPTSTSSGNTTVVDAAAGGTVSSLPEGDYVIAAGYRVQIYFGNDPKKARAEAQYRQSAVKNKFSTIGTYLTYNSPNFKVTVGDFPTREEAELFKQLLIKSFAFGRESFIVPAKIKYVVPKVE